MSSTKVSMRSEEKVDLLDRSKKKIKRTDKEFVRESSKPIPYDDAIL